MAASCPHTRLDTPFSCLSCLVLAVCKQGEVSPTVVVIHMHGQAPWLHSYCRYLSIQLSSDMSGVQTRQIFALVVGLGVSYVGANPFQDSGRFNLDLACYFMY